MAEAQNHKPTFRNAFRGYNKSEVDDYVQRSENALESLNTQQSQWEAQKKEMEAENARCQEMLENLRTEKEELLSKNAELNDALRNLEKDFQDKKDENYQLQQEVKKLQETIENSDHDPECIKEAIISAQRMSSIVMEEANQKADEIIRLAEELKLQKEEEARQIIEDVDEDVRHIVAEAEKKCEDLQNTYDRILMDVSGFKAEMIAMYRRHLELLYALPEAKSIPEKKTSDFVEIV